MELALLISEPAELDHLPDEVGGVVPSRLYFGNEFCERLLLGEAQLERAIEAAEKRQLGLSVVLPYLSELPFGRARELLAHLEARAPGAEVIVNDWGLLRVVASKAALVAVMGRCLNRSLADPRLPEHVGSSLPAGALAALRGGPLESPAFASLLARYRVSRVELDEPPLGLPPERPGAGVAVSIHAPYAFVASGRVCAFAGLSRAESAAPGDRFTPGPCRYECRDYELDLLAPPALLGRLPVLQRGNTVFVQHAQHLAEDVPALLARLSAFGDRLVWSAAAPMGGGPAS